MLQTPINVRNDQHTISYEAIDIEIQNNNIDYIIVNRIDETEHESERTIYERNLQDTGLELRVLELTDKHRFVKIHAPQNTLLQFCEIMKLKMPLKNFSEDGRNKLTEQFSRNKQYLFNMSSEDFLPPSVKYMIINFILENEKYHAEDDNNVEEYKFGITKLILEGAYEAAYPLHNELKRSRLKEEWASIKKCLKRQPVDDIKNYFGIKIALYFIWLEFYSAMLFPAAIFGIGYILIGLTTLSSNEIVKEMCTVNNTVIMCPQCDLDCDFWNVRNHCSYVRLTHLLDNGWSVIFTIIMSVGCVVYLNLWNRYSAEIVHSWGVSNNYLLDYELPTMDDLNKTNNKKKCTKLPKIIFSSTVVLFWILIVVAVLLALMFYRISLSASELLYGNTKATIVAVTGGIFDLISILILNDVYGRIAVWLTRREMHRTQKQYEESLMWKLYIFWFINYYSSFFYIAFLKGKFAGAPSHYNRIFGYRQEECGPGGCIADLFIQIAVVLIGDMTYNNIIEYLVPYLKKKCRSSKINSDIENDNNVDMLKCAQWIKDYKLLCWENKNISLEHLEMVLQYGMITLFIAAFPLAPLCALINNILEIRMDAINLLINFRRPVAQNVRNIGIWLTIMELISNLAVLTNGCIIAFTTNFIPHLVYKISMDYNHTNQTFLNFSLSRFNTADFDTTAVLKINMNISECRYYDYRNSPEHEQKYELSEMYWHILAARLIFVLLFQNIVAVLKLFINWLIPEMPAKLKTRILNECKRTQRFIIREENTFRRRTLN